MNMIATAHAIDDMPSVVRYPRGTGYGLEKLNGLFGLKLDALPEKGEALPVGKGRIIREGRAGADRKVAVLSLGTRLAASCEAAEELENSMGDVGGPRGNRFGQ